jgi:endoglucanase
LNRLGISAGNINQPLSIDGIDAPARETIPTLGMRFRLARFIKQSLKSAFNHGTIGRYRGSRGSLQEVPLRSQSLDLLKSFVHTPSPSGREIELARLYRQYLSPLADRVTHDVMGNVTAILNPDAPMRIMLAGHMDEIGFMVHYISSDGFLHISSIGGNDSVIADGQRVWVHGRERIAGVVGGKAMHLKTPEEQKQRPLLKELWVDVGAASKDELAELVTIGDTVTIQTEFQALRQNRATARAFDNKVGVFVVAEALRLIKEGGSLHPQVGIWSVATIQEEIGSRGAETAAFDIDPQVALAVDMGQALDYPKLITADQGEFYLGRGPGVLRGANTNPVLFDMLVKAAKDNDIPYQVTATPGTSPTDARVLQTSRSGVAAALLEVPLRYMHTPCEVVSLDDVANCARLLAEFCTQVTPETDFRPLADKDNVRSFDG